MVDPGYGSALYQPPFEAPPVDAANRTLSNLVSPTAINQDLIPDGSLTRSLGSAALPYFRSFVATQFTSFVALTNAIFGDVIGAVDTSVPRLLDSGDTTEFTIYSPATAITGVSDIGIQASKIAGLDSGGIYLSTANPDANLNSGDVKVYTGVVSGAGVRGNLVLDVSTVQFPRHAADPAVAVGGASYYNTVTGKLRVYNDVLAAWEDLN